MQQIVYKFIIQRIQAEIPHLQLFNIKLTMVCGTVKYLAEILPVILIIIMVLLQMNIQLNLEENMIKIQILILTLQLIKLYILILLQR